MKIVTYPDPILETKCVDLAAWDDKVEKKVRRMFKLMYKTGVGVALAAPQVGWNVRLFIMNADTETYKPSNERVFFNPEISLLGKEVLIQEGCLSLPELYHDIIRHDEVGLIANTRDGQIREDFTGLAAQIVQHECDHLNGRLFTDRVDPVIRKKLLERFRG